MTNKHSDQEASNPPQKGDLGRQLKELREGIGYSISQTAEAMCLSKELLTQLENEDFDSLPEPPYIRGYLRNYAKIAETDSSELISCYESLRGANPDDLNYHFKSSAKIHSKHKKNVSPILIQLLFLGILLGALLGLSMIPAVSQWLKTTWESFSVQNNEPSVDNTDNPLLTGKMPVPVALSTGAPPTNSAKNDANPAANSTNQQDNASPVNPTPNDTVTEIDKQAINIPSEKNIKVGEENQNEALIPDANVIPISIKLIFNKEVWMRIRDAKNKTVFEGQNAAGQVKELKLIKPLTFKVGNAQGLSLFVDDKAIDISPYIKGSTANFTLE